MRKLIFLSLEGGMFKIKVPADFSVGLSKQMVLSCCSYTPVSAPPVAITTGFRVLS